MSKFQSARPVRGGTSSPAPPPASVFDFNPPAPCGAGPPHIGRRRSRSPYFNPPAPCGAGHKAFFDIPIASAFQSARPVRGGTLLYRLTQSEGLISIRPPRAGRDYLKLFPALRKRLFQSARPVRGGTRTPQEVARLAVISIRPPRAGRDVNKWLESVMNGDISIRPPRAGRDGNPAQNFICAGSHNAQFNDCAGPAAHLLQPLQCNFSGYSSILRCEPTGVHL